MLSFRFPFPVASDTYYFLSHIPGDMCSYIKVCHLMDYPASQNPAIYTIRVENYWTTPSVQKTIYVQNQLETRYVQWKHEVKKCYIV